MRQEGKYFFLHKETFPLIKILKQNDKLQNK